jgi:putative ABC transport system permease protein
MKLDGSSQVIYDLAEETETKYPKFTDAAANMLNLKNDPVFQGTNGVLTVGFIVVLILCTVGFLIYWILSIQSRALQFGIFRAMGMSLKEVIAMLINEQVFVSGLAIAVGVAVGWLASVLFIPLIQIAYSSVDQAVPVTIVSARSDTIRLMVLVGAMIIICMGILASIIRHMKIAQALKLGED